MTLVAVGDISLGDHPVCASFGVDSLLRKRPHLDIFANVKDKLRDHDIVFGNLETVLSDNGLDSASYRSMHMRGRPSSISQLTNAGFNVLNIANNHILQHGRRAFDETLELLRANDVLPVGLSTGNGVNCQPARTKIRDTEVVFLGYAFEPEKYYRDTPLYAQADPRVIIDDIREVKTRENVVICSFHWGREYISYPGVDQIAIARSVVDAGCDLIVGHHPHVMNGFERYKGRYIFYSLGNFVFDQLWNEDCTTGMAIRARLSPGAVDVAGVNWIRIGRDYRPSFVDEPRLDERLKWMCAQIETTLRENGKKYLRDARREESRNRYLSWLYLLKYFYRYDPRILRQIVAEALYRRVRSAGDNGSPENLFSGS